MIRRVKWAVLAAAMLLCAGGAYAQDCGCNQVDTGYNAYGQTGHNHYKHWYGHDRYAYNCGRGITNGQAAALWAGYCHEDCSYKGENCGNCSLWGA